MDPHHDAAQFLLFSHMGWNDESSDSDDEDALVDRARKLRTQNGRLAARLLGRALSQAPRDHRLYLEMADLHFRNRHYEAAVQAAESCIKIEPAFVKGYVQKGRAELQLRRWHAARKTLEAGIRLDPENTALTSMLGMVMNKLNLGRDAKYRLLSTVHRSARRASGAGVGALDFLSHVRTRYLSLLGSGATGARSDAPIPSIVNLPALLPVSRSELLELYEGGTVDRERDVAAGLAVRYLETLAPAEEGTTTVVFDVDDTALCSYAAMKANQFRHVLKMLPAWCQEQEAVAVPQVRALHDYCRKRGFRTVFLSGRPEEAREATEANLKREGFEGYDQILLRPQRMALALVHEHKARARASLAQDQGLAIVMTVGDQDSDFRGDPETTGFAVRIPNYMYAVQ